MSDTLFTGWSKGWMYFPVVVEVYGPSDPSCYVCLLHSLGLA